MLSVSPLISASPLAAVSLTREVPALAGRNEPLKLMRCMMARTATGDSRIAVIPNPVSPTPTVTVTVSTAVPCGQPTALTRATVMTSEAGG